MICTANLTLILFVHKNHTCLNCYLFNAQSIISKLDELHHILYTVQIDCVFITETWLSSNVSDGLLDPRSEFTIVRHDRSGGRGGGVCVIIKKSYTIIPFNISTSFDHLEVVGFDIVNAVPPVRVFVVYRPPYYDDAAVRYANSLIEFFY